MKRKGFGVEDTPFMILATVAVMMLVVWIGVGVMASFVEGNEYQAAVEASTEIYKRAKLLSLGYDGSSERLRISIPEGYSVRVDGDMVAMKLHYINDSATNETELTERMGIQGVDIVGSDDAIPSGEHEVLLIYNSKHGEVQVSWE